MQQENCCVQAECDWWVILRKGFTLCECIVAAVPLLAKKCDRMCLFDFLALLQNWIRTGPLPAPVPLQHPHSSLVCVICPCINLSRPRIAPLSVYVTRKCKTEWLRSFPYLAEVSFPHFIHHKLSSRECVGRNPVEKLIHCEVAEVALTWAKSGVRSLWASQLLADFVFARRWTSLSLRHTLLKHRQQLRRLSSRRRGCCIKI